MPPQLSPDAPYRSGTRSRRSEFPQPAPQVIQAPPDPRFIWENFKWSMNKLDFERFFEAFPVDSVVSSYINSFSVKAFGELMESAFTDIHLEDYSSPRAQEVRNARTQLEEELQNLDLLLKEMAEAGFQVQHVKESFNWVRTANKRSLGLDTLQRAVKVPTTSVHGGGDRSPVVESANMDQRASAGAATPYSPGRKGYHSTPTPSLPSQHRSSSLSYQPGAAIPYPPGRQDYPSRPSGHWHRSSSLLYLPGTAMPYPLGRQGWPPTPAPDLPGHRRLNSSLSYQHSAAMSYPPGCQDYLSTSTPWTSDNHRSSSQPYRPLPPGPHGVSISRKYGSSHCFVSGTPANYYEHVPPLSYDHVTQAAQNNYSANLQTKVP